MKLAVMFVWPLSVILWMISLSLIEYTFGQPVPDLDGYGGLTLKVISIILVTALLISTGCICWSSSY